MSEIEKQFFETFGIEPNKVKISCDKCCYSMEECGCFYCEDDKYPPITDRILLELICILNDFEGIDVKATTVKELKEELLKQAIVPFKYPIAFEEHHEIDKLYHQVQVLFKENNNE